jgi:hypothetical protein
MIKSIKYKVKPTSSATTGTSSTTTTPGSADKGSCSEEKSNKHCTIEMGDKKLKEPSSSIAYKKSKQVVELRRRSEDEYDEDEEENLDEENDVHVVVVTTPPAPFVPQRSTKTSASASSAREPSNKRSIRVSSNPTGSLSDSGSSSESGFGTVDDDVDNSSTSAAATTNITGITEASKKSSTKSQSKATTSENAEAGGKNVNKLAKSQSVISISSMNDELNCEPEKRNNINKKREQSTDKYEINMEIKQSSSQSQDQGQQQAQLPHEQQQQQEQGQQMQQQQPPADQLPILQATRANAYKLNGVSASREDVVNILNDNSSINSLSSSMNSGNRLSNCCSKTYDKFMKCYYSCFCCYSSQTNQTPLIWSWLNIFCCCCPLLGGISLYFTHRSKKLKLKQKYDLAEKYSNYAEKLNIASLVIGIIFYAIAFFIITVLIFIYWRHNNS